MDRFDLQSEEANLFLEFDRVINAGTVAILEWFYKTLDYQRIFTTPEYASNIYNKLVKMGYKEVSSPIDELEYSKKLLQFNGDESADKVGYAIIAILMKYLKDAMPINATIEHFITIYNEVYNKEKTFTKMMKKLNDNIGETVVFVVVINNNLRLLSGVLEAIDEYSSVTINGEKYPFVGFGVVISKITNISGEVLYNNTKASTQDDLTNTNLVEKMKVELFGINDIIRKVC